MNGFCAHYEACFLASAEPYWLADLLPRFASHHPADDSSPQKRLRPKACYYCAMNDFEKRWQRISQLLQAEATGKEHPMISSGRTLFGIKSSTEEKMDRFAKEIEEEYAAKRKAQRENTQESRISGSESATNAKSARAGAVSSEDLVDRVRKQMIADATAHLEEQIRKNKERQE